MADEAPFDNKLAKSYHALAAAASELNTVSDEVGKSIAAADESLRKLNLGVKAWVKIDQADDEAGYSTRYYLGYTRMNGKWGIALSEAEFDPGEDLCDSEEWLFSDAPRWLRIQAMDHLPKLLDALAKEASSTTSTIKKKITQVRQFAHTLGERAEANAKGEK